MNKTNIPPFPGPEPQALLQARLAALDTEIFTGCKFDVSEGHDKVARKDSGMQIEQLAQNVQYGTDYSWA